MKFASVDVTSCRMDYIQCQRTDHHVKVKTQAISHVGTWTFTFQIRKGPSFVPVETTGGQERCLSVGKTERMFDNDQSQAIIRNSWTVLNFLFFKMSVHQRQKNSATRLISY